MSAEGLIDKVVALEAEANTVLKKAHAEAKSLQEGASARIEGIRAEAEAALQARLSAFRAEAGARHASAVKKLQASLREETARLEGLDGEAVERQAGTVLAALLQQD